MRLTLVTAIALSIILTGCASQYVSEDELYQRAEEAVEAENYETAKIELEQLAENFPFGRYAQQVELELIHVALQNREPSQALLRANRFIRLQPDHPHLDYAYFMKALAQFNMAAGERGGWSDSAAKRDLTPVEGAYDSFGELIRRFPDSQYNADARTYMAAARAIMAKHQLNQAQLYERKEAWAAALANAQTLLNTYPGSQYSEPAQAIVERATAMLTQ